MNTRNKTSVSVISFHGKAWNKRPYCDTTLHGDLQQKKNGDLQKKLKKIGHYTPGTRDHGF
jgi:glycerol-3-phosphate cytidylyltransferase-like family protein